MQNNIIELIKKELAIDNLPEEEVEKVIGDLGGQIMQNVLVNFTSSLSDQEILEWDEVLEAGDQDKVNAFILNHAQNIDELVISSSREIIDLFKESRVA